MPMKTKIGIVAAVVLAAATASAAVRYNVTDAQFGKPGASFGANGSDKEDDFYAIQNALNMAKGSAEDVEVYIPKGTYRISSSLAIYSHTILTLDKDAVMLRTSPDFKVMLASRHLGDSGLEDCPRDETCHHGGHSQLSDVVISGGTWDGGDFPESVSGAFCLLHGRDIAVRNVAFRHFTEHIVNVSASKNVTIEGCTFSDAIKYTGTSEEFWSYYDYTVGDSTRYLSIEALHLDVANVEGEPSTFPHDDTPCRDVTVKNCTFRDVFAGAGNHHAIDGAPNDGFVVDGCTFERISSFAMHIHGFTNCVVKGNRAVDCAGLAWSREASLSVMDNVVTGATSHGIHLASSRTVVERNNLTGVENNGVNVEDGHVSVSGNVISGCGQSGVRINGGDGSQVYSNVVENAGSEGVNVSRVGNIVIRRNVIKSPGTIGIAVLQSDSPLIEGNTVTNSAKSGVFVESGDSACVTENEVSGNSQDLSDAFSFKKCRNLKVRGNRGLDCAGNGFVVNGCIAELEGNRAASIGKNAFAFVNNASVDAFRNEVEGAGDMGMYLEGARDGLCEGNRIEGCRYAFSARSSSGFGLVSNSFSRSEGHGVVFMNGCTNVLMSFNVVSNSTKSGVTIVSGGDLLAVSNEVSQSGLFGLFAEDGACLHAQGNRILESTQDGIRLLDSGDSDIVGNLISGAEYGINASGECGATLVDGNEIRSCRKSGVMLNGCRALLAANRIFSPALHGVQTVNGAGLTALENTVQGAGEAGFGLSGCVDSHLSDNEAECCKVGVNANSCRGLWILGNLVSDTAEHGLVFMSCEDTEALRNRVVRAAKRGISVNGGRTHIAQNEVSDAGQQGICVEAGEGVEIVGNVVSGASGTGMRLMNMSGGDVSRNVVTGSTGSGIHVSGSSKVTVTRNSVRETSGTGVLIQQSEECSAVGNDVDGTGSGGVSLQDTSDGSILSNRIVNARGSAISIAGAGVAVEGNEAESVSDWAILVDSGTDGSSVKDNVVGGDKGVGISSSVLDSIEYELPPVPAMAERQDNDTVLVKWREYPARNGVVRYVVEYSTSADFSNFESVEVSDAVETVLTQVSTEDIFVRVRAVHAISGREYATPPGEKCIARPGRLHVCLDKAGGTGGDSSAEAQFGDNLPDLLPPSRYGYVFCGYWTGLDGAGDKWYDADGKGVIACPKDFSDFVLYAAWSRDPEVEVPADGEVVSVQVVFDVNGGFPAIPPAQLVDGEPIGSVLPPAPSRAGWVFGGWETEGGTAVGADYVVNSSDSPLRLVARWTQASYAVTFDADGGEGGCSQTLACGDALVPPVVTKVGHEFNGWLPEPPDVVPAMDLTCVAQWKLGQYRVTFDAAGGNGGKSSLQDYGSEIAAPTATRAGYKFAGWTPSVPATVPANDVTFTAQWTINRYTVTFVMNDGSTRKESKEYEYGAALETFPSPTRTGYMLEGWFTTASGGGKVETTARVAGSMTLYAHWKPDGSAPVVPSWTVTFDPNGGEFANDEDAERWVAKGKALGTPPVPVREGYALAGWYTAKTKGSKISASTKITKDVTYYARWTIKKFKMSAAVSSKSAGTVSGAGTKKFGGKATFKASPKKGFVFVQWLDVNDPEAPWPDAASCRQPSVKFVVPARNVSVKAVFAKASADVAPVLAVESSDDWHVDADPEREISVAADSLSYPAVTLSGAPAGLELVRVADTDCKYVLKVTEPSKMKPGVYTTKITAKNRAGKRVSKTVRIVAPNSTQAIKDGFIAGLETSTLVPYVVSGGMKTEWTLADMGVEVSEGNGWTLASVSGLPKGLSWNGKAIVGAASKTGVYTVTFKMQKTIGSGKTKKVQTSTASATFAVEALLPASLAGTYNGFANTGIGTAEGDGEESVYEPIVDGWASAAKVTVTKAGKITANVLGISLSGSGFDDVSNGIYSVLLTKTTKIKSGKLKGKSMVSELRLEIEPDAPWNSMQLAGDYLQYTAGVPSVAAPTLVVAQRNAYGSNGSAQAKAIAAAVAKFGKKGASKFKAKAVKGEAWSYDLVSGSGVTVTAKANGSVTLAGKIGTTKVSGTATLEVSGSTIATARFFSGKFVVEVYYEITDGAVVSATGRAWKK